MQAFAQLLDRLSLEPRRLAKEALLVRYFSETPDPDRGYALAALTGGLTFKHAKPAMLRALISERTDPVLFGLSYDFVGDMSETIALMWPRPEDAGLTDAPSLSEIVERLSTSGKSEVPGQVAGWLDSLDDTGRWALLKLITGGLRVGVSARLAKTSIAKQGDLSVNQVEEVWHGLKPPYETLFAWVEGRAGPPETEDPAPFRPVMLAHPLDAEKDLQSLDAGTFAVEWKWDGIRVQAASGLAKSGPVKRLFSRTGDDISRAFPDVMDILDFNAAIDGELLIRGEDGVVRPFSDLQKRLNRKTAGPKLIKEYPAAIRVYDLLVLEGEDLRDRPFRERRQKLEVFVQELDHPGIDLSPMVEAASWDDIAAARSEPGTLLPQDDADAVEGLMLKRWDAPYVTGRPKGLWYKWKREPRLIDAVLMYAQRGHGKRSSFYSDYTFGVWRPAADGDELVPVGKAYFGFTDEELREIDRFVRKNTINRFGPVSEVAHGKDHGLVLEIAFEGLNRSTRHKSGVAMRFPRVSRLRWDKPAAEADWLETLETMLPSLEKAG
ncbi:cisplatin damage response ATP-dependent DNA ligase [Roseibium denhamense]|uniref:DNA ligase (ATP) n=1 Tax=Roseibium denhamense TaxID=76305 RepID=A0ABY1P5U0_9HYPH|nr:cisplatin damage response ATP-dependent DNA ligase [Roseibium denhamense]MTI07228.1 cisplatin damage response ATP-dependent DNA ligase [Roseibium denhamense]SMP26430.1 DNA ligase-1 [Roseibium denhamense]